MGIRKGVTLIKRGGFHGKSTLLQSVDCGIYNHIPGDGRELVVTPQTVVKVWAEGGRSVTSVDTSPFISGFPSGDSSTLFSTREASGSTSQAASIVEFVEASATACCLTRTPIQRIS
jgi:predicted ABC-class ATPase